MKHVTLTLWSNRKHKLATKSSICS